MKTPEKLNNSTTNAALNSCRTVLAQIAKAKNANQIQFRDLIAEHEQIFRAALAEAETLAWQTPFPQLVFLDLAEERARDAAQQIARENRA